MSDFGGTRLVVQWTVSVGAFVPAVFGCTISRPEPVGGETSNLPRLLVLFKIGTCYSTWFGYYDGDYTALAGGGALTLS